MTARRFPPPWSVDELEACFVVKDEAGQKLTYVYYEEEPGRRSAAKLLSKDEARRIAANIAKLCRSYCSVAMCSRGRLTFSPGAVR
jgi:hypothetical protein